MTHLKYLIFCLLLTPYFDATAEKNTNENKARAYYFAAEEAYAQQKFDDALTAITEAESLLNKSNARISSLRVKILFEIKDYVAAKKELQHFYTFQAQDDLVREMSSFQLKLDKLEREQVELARQKAEKEAAERRKREEQAAIERERQERARLATELALKAKEDAIRKQLEKEQALVNTKKYYTGEIGNLTEHARLVSWTAMKMTDNTSMGRAYDVIEETPGNYIVAHGSIRTLKSGVANNSSHLMRVNMSGYKSSTRIDQDFNWKCDPGEDYYSAIFPTGTGFQVIGNRLCYPYPRAIVGDFLLVNYDNKLKAKKQILGNEKDNDKGKLNDVIIGNDGNFVAVGSGWPKEKYGRNVNDTLWVAKYTPKGKSIWIKNSLDSKINFSGVNVLPLAEGGYIVAAQSIFKDTSDSKYRIFLANYDEQGNILQVQYYYRPNKDLYQPIHLRKDGKSNFLALIQMWSKEAEKLEVQVLRLNPKLEIIQNVTFPLLAKSNAKDIIATDDGGYLILVDEGARHTELQHDVMLVKVNAEGNSQWVRHFGSAANESSVRIIKNSVGNYVVIGLQSPSPLQNISKNQIFLAEIALTSDID